MDDEKLHSVLRLATAFAMSYSDVLALGLCGSWARGCPKPHSDIDLCIVTKDKLRFKSHQWVHELKLSLLDEHLVDFRDAIYGNVWSRHGYLSQGTEIEFSFADRNWAESGHTDQQTARVILEGFKIVYDPELLLNGLLSRLHPAS